MQHDGNNSTTTGLSLPLRSDRGEESKFDDIEALQEAPITVEFVMPDDSTIKSEFKKGQTVQVLKCFLEEECELELPSIQLFYRDKLMLDPFSLTDFSGVESARSITLSVRIDTTKGSSSPDRRK